MKSKSKKSEPELSVIHEHDKFSRAIMEDKRVARDFLEAHLPQEILSITDLDTLELQPRILSDETRSESAVDVLFKVKIAGQDAYLFILAEHQNVPDKMMPFRIIHYTCKIIAKHLKRLKSEGKKADLLPLIHPIVFYNGKRQWKYSRDIRDIVDAPKELVDKYFLQPFQLVDLSQIADATLREHLWVGVAAVIMKHIYATDILPFIRELVDQFKRIIDQSGGRDYIEILLQYTISKGEVEDDEAFFDLIRTEISPDMEDTVMTLAQKLEQRGIQTGLQQGIQKGLQQGIQSGLQQGQLEIARAMLTDGVEPVFVSKYTRLAMEEVLTLKYPIANEV